MSLTLTLLCEALNSLVSFWAKVLDTVRAQNWTVPVALTPKLADPGPVADDAAGVELEDEQPAAAAATRAVAENSANVLLFMCRFLQDVFGAKAQRVLDRPGCTVQGRCRAGRGPLRYCVGHGPRRLRPALAPS